MVNGAYKLVSGTAAGTTTLIDSRSGKLNGIWFGGTSAGTVAFHDAGSSTTPGAGNQILPTINLVTVGTAPKFEPFKCDVKSGLKVVTTGASYDFTVVVE